MAGPAVHAQAAPEALKLSFGTIGAADAGVMLQIMSILHREPLASSFSALLSGREPGKGGLDLAHFFEEIGALALHGLVTEELLFDAFALDHYWDQLRPVVEAARRRDGNAKFGENFELLATAAAEYRRNRPPKSLGRAAAR